MLLKVEWFDMFALSYTTWKRRPTDNNNGPIMSIVYGTQAGCVGAWAGEQIMFGIAF